MTDCHLLRPLWLLMFIPLLVLCFALLRKKASGGAWRAVCDETLLPYLMQSNQQQKRFASVMHLFIPVALMIIALSGPTWQKISIPAYKPVIPRIIILDLTPSMLSGDISPSRLQRAKFKLRDLLSHTKEGQFGLIVFSGEPFTVSPITEDAHTIATFLPDLSPDILPVGGYQLDKALMHAHKMLEQAGYAGGDLLVVTSRPPSQQAVREAAQLANQGIHTSVLPMLSVRPSSMFKQFSDAGNGSVLSFTHSSDDVMTWLAQSRAQGMANNPYQDVPVWHEEGRWFLLMALLSLLPVFRRGWLARIQI